MYTILLAGGIGAGKSTVAQHLAQLGAEIIDLDQVSREVLEPHAPLVYEVARLLGPEVLDEQAGTLKRTAVARLVFSDSKLLEELEALELPAIFQRTRERLAEAEQAGTELVVIEVPVLPKAGELLDVADEVVVVLAGKRQQIERAHARGDTNPEARLAQQPSEAWLRSQADTVWDNSGTIEQIFEEIAKWLHTHELLGYK